MVSGAQEQLGWLVLAHEVSGFLMRLQSGFCWGCHHLKAGLGLGPTFKMALSHDWQAGFSAGLVECPPNMMAISPKVSHPRDQSSRCTAFHDLALEVTCHNSYCIL